MCEDDSRRQVVCGGVGCGWRKPAAMLPWPWQVRPPTESAAPRRQSRVSLLQFGRHKHVVLAEKWATNTFDDAGCSGDDLKSKRDGLLMWLMTEGACRMPVMRIESRKDVWIDYGLA